MLKIGCHLSTAKGYTAMGEQILTMGGNTFQFFTKNPKGRGSTTPPDEADVAGLYHLIETGKLYPPMAHAPYTYNPCSLDDNVRQYTEDSMRKELQFLEALPGSFYNFHPGYHVGRGTEEGIRLIGEMLDRVLWQGMHTTVLLETMAGKGTEIGRDFQELRQILDTIDPSFAPYVGICLDTCHVQDSGYKLEQEEDGTSNVEKVLNEFDRVIGLDRLCAIHLNDSRNPCGTRKDRHDRLGEGYIGMAAMQEIVTHPRLAHLPFYLETPNEIEGFTKEIAMVKSWRKR